MKYSHFSSPSSHNTNNPLTSSRANWSDEHYTDANKSLASFSDDKEYEFIKCSWNGCKGTRGGAIVCDGNRKSLTLNQCSFDNCASQTVTSGTNGYYAGGVSVVSLSSLVVKYTLFHKCIATQIENNNAAGGLFVSYVTSTISIRQNDFILCEGGASGGGAYIELCQSSNVGTETVRDCRCVECKATTTSPDGGGICLSENIYTIGCSNCLLAHCEANVSNGGAGGGIDILVTSVNPRSLVIPIVFCFFHKNAATSGADVRIREYPSSTTNPFLHCFSTSEETRALFSNNGQNVPIDNWLPQGLHK